MGRKKPIFLPPYQIDGDELVDMQHSNHRSPKSLCDAISD